MRCNTTTPPGNVMFARKPSKQVVFKHTRWIINKWIKNMGVHCVDALWWIPGSLCPAPHCPRGLLCWWTGGLGHKRSQCYIKYKMKQGMRLFTKTKCKMNKQRQENVLSIYLGRPEWVRLIIISNASVM